MMLVQNPPSYSLTTEELDRIYSLPYMRAYHPSYESVGGVPGIEEVKFSITHNRGCFGYCNFCSIALHQGRRITCRSEESILDEARRLTEMPDFKGYIHDVEVRRQISENLPVKSRLSWGFARERSVLLRSRVRILKRITVNILIF